MPEPITDQVFSSELLPGETIQWSGQPNPSVIFHPEDKFVIPFTLLWGGFAIFWLVMASGIGDDKKTLAPFGLIWGTPFVVVGQYVIWGRFVYTRWKKQRTYYALTDRRALVVFNGFSGRSSSSAYYDNLPITDKWVRHDGIGSISFGGPLTGEWRSRGDTSPRPLTFDDVHDADSVYRLVIQFQDQVRKSVPD